MKYKYYFTISCLVLFFSMPALGQNITLQQGMIEHNEKQRPCVQVSLKAPQPKPLKKAWEDFMDDEYDVNMKGIGFLSNKDILTAQEVNIPAMSDKSLNFYTRIIEQGNQTEMCVFSSFGYDIYATPEEYPQAFETMEKMTAQFLRSYLPEYYHEKIEVSMEEVEDIRSEISDLEETMADNTKEIEELKAENAEIEKNLIDQKEKLRKAEQILNTHELDFNQVKKDLAKIEM